MEILRGKPVADQLCAGMEQDIDKLLGNNIVPTLAIVRVGEKESDISYEKSAVKKAESLGIYVEKFILSEDAAESDLLDVLKYINDNKNIHGMLLFRPLPPHMNDERVRNHLAPAKDIDGITDESMAGLFTGNGAGFPPCTAEAVMAVLRYYGADLKGKRAVVIGRSLVIGKPVAMMLMAQNATVTICHSKTPAEDLKMYCRQADIIVCASGHMNTITAEHVNGKQIIIDVGVNFDDEGKMHGDADFDGITAASPENNMRGEAVSAGAPAAGCAAAGVASARAAAITPVPGGIGAVTTALLMYHVVKAAMTAGTAQGQDAMAAETGRQPVQDQIGDRNDI